MREITVLHVFNRIWSRSGGYSYPPLNYIVQNLNPNSYRHIICYLSGPIPDNETLRVAGFDVRELPYRCEDIHHHFRLGVVRRVRRIIKGEKIDIIHAHRHKSTVYATLAAMGIKGVKVVCTLHSTNRLGSLERRLIHRLLWPRVSKIVAISQATRKDILTYNSWCSPEKIIVIHRAIPVADFANPGVNQTESRMLIGLPDDCFLWGTVGRLRPVKGHDILLKAWAKGRLGRQGGHLAIAGSGGLLPELEAQAKRLQIDKEVTFLGEVKEIPKFLAGLDGFVFSSRREPFGRALVEAMAAKLPVVASKIGGIPEIISGLHREGHAFLVPIEQPEALTEAMSKIMKWDQARRRASIDATRKRASAFDIQFMINKIDKLYRNLTKNHNGLSGEKTTVILNSKNQT